ncbi:hypothetical protein RSAG8_08578, partial [Rhizoctonia solani AG-8 WAC10335]
MTQTRRHHSRLCDYPTHLNYRGSMSILLTSSELLYPLPFPLTNATTGRAFFPAHDLSTYFRQVYCNDLQISADAFPALKHLELNSLLWRTIANICNLKPLVGGLHVMAIDYPVSSDVESTSDPEQQLSLSDIIPILAANNSSIDTFSVYSPGNCELSPKGVQSWACLPLIRLHLGWYVILEGDLEDLCTTLSFLPLLEDLVMPTENYPLNLKELRTIIEHSPRLHHIQIPVKWEPWSTDLDFTPYLDFTPCQSQSDQELRITSDFYLPDPEQESAEQLARYLSLLRPASRVSCESASSTFFDRATNEYIGEEPKNMINASLSDIYHK